MKNKYPRIVRLYAYAIEPGDSGSVEGGKVPADLALTDLLRSAAAIAELPQQTSVALAVDPSTRTSEVRNHIKTFAFSGGGQSGKAAALALAIRLQSAMDRRSAACLFVAVATQRDKQTRRVTFWTFPKEEALRFAMKAKPEMTILKDVFSTTSRLRKAALFEGTQAKTQFLFGRVLDLQARGGAGKEIADYWINKFLGATLMITSNEGTKLLAKNIRVVVPKSWTA